MYRKRFIITESEKSHIRNLYGLNLIKEENETSSCPAFNENIKNQVIDYQTIIDTFSATTPSYTLEQIQNLITQKINEGSKSFISNGVPVRTACQMSFIGLRPEFQKDLKLAITDPRNNWVYFYKTKFNPTTKTHTWEFIAKDPYISGRGLQPTDPEWIKMNNMSLTELQDYLNNNDIRDKNNIRVTSADVMSKLLDEANAGIYVLGQSAYQEGYSGPSAEEGGNINYNFQYQQGGKTKSSSSGFATHAIPGSQSSEKYGQRWTNILRAKQKAGSADLEKGSNIPNKDLNMSSSCINFHPNLYTLLNQKGFEREGTLLFNIGDQEQNYYVKTVPPNDNKCYSPQSLGITDANYG